MKQGQKLAAALRRTRIRRANRATAQQANARQSRGSHLRLVVSNGMLVDR